MIADQRVDPAVFTDVFGMKVDPTSCPWVGAGQVETRPPFPSNYFADGIEFAALALALELAAGQAVFTAVELGAGWGPWITLAAVCAKRAGFEHAALVAFEADPHRFAALRRHLALNGITEDSYQLSLHCAAAWWRDETLYWPSEQNDLDAGRTAVAGEKPTHDYRGNEFTFAEIPGRSIADALRLHPRIDFLHMDIQGGEWDVVSKTLEFLSSHVTLMFIGTHSRKIEGDLIDLLRNNGWMLMRERPCSFYPGAASPTLTGQTVLDGGQVWGNRRLMRDRFWAMLPAIPANR